MVELRLAMSVPAPVIAISEEELVLDTRFVDSMHPYVCNWDGPIYCFMRQGAHNIPCGKSYAVHDLNFNIRLLNEGSPLPLSDFGNYDVTLLCGDNDLDILSQDSIKTTACPIVYKIEYTHGNRQSMNNLEAMSIGQKLVRAGRIGLKELERRRAFFASAGIQMNGYPAYDAYGKLNSSPIVYLENCATADLIASREDMDRRRLRLLSEKPLRLYHSGRLERMNGSHHLIPLAVALRQAAIPFSLEIYGTGLLHAEMSSAISSHDLNNVVHMHGPIDHRTDLVPVMRGNADIFVSCDLRPNPLSTYLETLACGVPIVGFNNRMLGRLNAASGGGWHVPAGNITRMAHEIGRLHRNRGEIIKASVSGLAFASEYDLDNQIKKRMEHVAKIAGGLRRARFI